MNVSSIIDFSAVTPYHLVLLINVFVAVTVGLALLVLARPGALRVPARRVKVYYGGVVLVCVMVVAAAAVLQHNLLVIGLVVSAAVVALAGFVDERWQLTPPKQLIFQLLIAVIVVHAGWTIPHISNPLGEGVLMLDWKHIGQWLIPGSIVAVVWLMLFMNAINWLDGVDGLASSVACIACIALAAISLLPSIQRVDMFALSLIGIGGALAILLWNFPYAKVYLGTTGSWFIGLYIGLVAMYGGGKIVTGVLILALPILDAFFVIIQRMIHGQALWRGDRVHHLHYRLRSAGWSDAQITTGAALFTFLCALLAIVLSTIHKIMVLVALFILFAVLLGVLMRYKKEPLKKQTK